MYHAILWIDWAFDINVVINMNQWNMTFERNVLKVIVPLDHAEGAHNTELVHDFLEDDDGLDWIYKIMAWDKDWIKSIVDGWIMWDKDNSCTLDSDEELKYWHN